jgi:anhydro-N-acetylmuramic acid kinase
LESDKIKAFHSLLQFNMSNVYHAIGIMSGTSLDGLDISLSSYSYNKNSIWSFEVIRTATITYSIELRHQLEVATELSGLELKLLENRWSNFAAEQINLFLNESRLKPDLIGNHGHTIFHQTDKKLTYQLANNSIIAVETGIPTIGDFRSADVALGGQGAPLVPIGDLLLFSQYDCCINLGGIANLSFTKKNETIAYDCCPFNIPLNILSNKLGFEFDSGGEIASKGKIDRSLLKELKALPYFSINYPKSLGIEWIKEYFMPIINKYDISTEDSLATLIELYTELISTILIKNKFQHILITGGGTHNSFFIEQLKIKSNIQIAHVEKETINFKEAIIFGFLGVLRWRKEHNTVPSVTGASRAHSSGGLYLP